MLMMVLIYIAAAVVLLGLCIFVHELGHLLGGRMVGIKARIFSMGYGRGFIKKKFGDTTWQVTLIPFGGYCQFYGENPGDAALESKPADPESPDVKYSFSSAAPWRRMVTVFMGPFFNLLFGIFLFFIMNMAGYTKDTNRIQIPEDMRSGEMISAAWQAGLRDGDRITAVNGRTIRGFDDIRMKVYFCDGSPLEVEYERDGEVRTAAVTPVQAEEGRYVIGVLPYGKHILIAGLEDGEAGKAAGLQEYDEVLALDLMPVKSADDFTDIIRTRAGRSVLVTVKRRGEEKTFSAVPRKNTVITLDGRPVFDVKILEKMAADMSLKLNGSTVFSVENFLDYVRTHMNSEAVLERDGHSLSGKIGMESRGFLGVRLGFSPEQTEVTYTFTEALQEAVLQPFDFIVLNLKGLGLMFSGRMNVRENLSGPVRIAQIAGDVAYYKGISAFVLLMAQISIILMVMNLLPVPAVDGSHILFYFIETVRRKPLDPVIMQKIQTAGVLILICLGVFVIINDISMLPFIQRLFH